MNDTGTRTLERELVANASWLRSLARALVGESCADDLMQSTIEAALNHPPATDRSLRPWLRRVATNTARMQWRSRARRIERDLDSPPPQPLESADEAMQKLEAYEWLVDAVRHLDEPFREAIMLHFVDGNSAAAIARQLGVPAVTIRSRVKRGLEKLRSDFDRED